MENENEESLWEINKILADAIIKIKYNCTLSCKA